MTGMMAALIGGLFATGFYFLLQRQPLRLVLGIAFLSHGANALIFVAGDLVRGTPPLIPGDAETLSTLTADPLPQALILTAIVIGFGLLSFILALVDRMLKARPTHDLDVIRDEEAEA